MAVVVHHASYELTGLDIETWLPDAEGGAFGVDVFFIISGFVMVHASRHLFGDVRNGPGFMMRRIGRVAPFYWLVSTCLLAVTLAVWIRDGVPNGAAAWVFGSYLFLPVVNPAGLPLPILGVGWTLIYEMWFYVVFACRLGSSARRAAAVITILFVGFVLLRGSIPLPFALDFLFNPLILEFAAGMWLALIYGHGLRLPRRACFAAAGIAAAVGLGIGHLVYGPLIAYRAYIWGPLAFVIVAGLALAHPPKTMRMTPLRNAAAVMGDASYAIYLTHMPAFWLLQVITREEVFSGLRHGAIYTPLLIFGAAGVGVAAHFIVERPLLDLVRGRPMRVPGLARLRSARG